MSQKAKDRLDDFFKTHSETLKKMKIPKKEFTDIYQW